MKRPRAHISILLSSLIALAVAETAHAAPPDQKNPAPARDAPEVKVGDQEKPAPRTAPPAPASRRERELPVIQRNVDAIKPLPPTPIPDDPPPHEGAILELPYVIEAPDLMIVEVPEALPGKPITGEHLVRADGSISLNFYGNVHVQGLTPRQAKAKIIHHLRRFLAEDSLGFYVAAPEDEAMALPAVPQSRDPFDDKPATGPAPEAPGTRPQAGRTEASGSARAPDDHAPHPNAPDEFLPEEKLIDGLRFVRIDPADSSAVFVDIASYNSKYYYVDGDLATTGRWPLTGRDTVLDAIQLAGGFIPTADRRNIRLVRPARGDKPARVFPIDFEAIVAKGDRRANLQVFPGDRLVVGRDPVVKTTIEVDRVAGQIHSALTSMQLSSIVTRNLFPTESRVVARVQIGGATWTLQAADSAPQLTPAQREETVKAWVEFWSKAATRAGVDDALLRDALLRHLNPVPAPANGAK